MRLLIFLLLLLPARLVAQAGPIAGTYAVWLCSSDCAVSDTAAAPVAGYLVISDDTLRTSTLPEEAREALERQSSFLLRFGPVRTPNACFSLARRTANIQLLAGIIPMGLTVWRSNGDTLTVRLYASPDAFYTLAAVIHGESLLGSGSEHGYVGQPFDRQVGPVHGLRVGPPDLLRCIAERPAP